MLAALPRVGGGGSSTFLTGAVAGPAHTFPGQPAVLLAGSAAAAGVALGYASALGLNLWQKGGSAARRKRQRLRQTIQEVSSWPVPTDYYGLLGLPRFSATPDEVRNAYRRLVKLVHPDILGGETKELTTLVTTAYHTLRDVSKRAAYDEALSGQGGLHAMTIASGSRGSAAKEANGKRCSTWSPDAPAEAEGVFVDETRCVICWHCVECAPNTFVVDQEGSGRARVVEQYADSAEDIEWATVACPTGAISYVSREDLGALEEIMPTCDLSWRSMHARRPIGPWEKLTKWKLKQAEEEWRLKARGQNKHNVSALADSIARAAAALPEDVRSRAWPALTTSSTVPGVDGSGTTAASQTGSWVWKS